MSKSAKTALAIALVLLVSGAMLIGFSLLRGVNIRDIWNNASVSTSLISTGYENLTGYTVCETGKESFSPDEVRRIDLGWIAGSVTLEPGGDRIALTERCSQPLQEDQKLCWKLEEGTLSIRFCSALRTKMEGKDLTLRFPADWTAERVSVDATSADIGLRGLQVNGALTVDATSGDLHLTDCRCDSLDAGATSGSVDLSGCECRDLSLSATSGGLRADGCRCDKLTAGTTSGSIAVRCEAKSIELGSTSGSIRCEEVPAGCDVTCSSTSGSVRLNLGDMQNDQRITIDTTSGDVYLDIPGAIDLDFDTASGDMSGRLAQGGSGCTRVEVETTSGDLILGAFD